MLTCLGGRTFFALLEVSVTNAVATSFGSWSAKARGIPATPTNWFGCLSYPKYPDMLKDQVRDDDEPAVRES